jgi:hypothetical protein
VGKFISVLTGWVAAKAIAAFMLAVMMVVLIVGVVTSDVGSISLSWKIYDMPAVEGVIANEK